VRHSAKLSDLEDTMAIGLGQLTLLGLFGGAAFGGDELRPAEVIEVQHLRPTKPDRQLELTNVSWFFARKSIVPGRLDLNLGATATRAKGSITQLKGSFEDGTLRTETLDSPAWGLGPTVNANLRVFDVGAARFNLDVSGSVMLYDRGFPSGGSWYNGMVQAGPSLQLRFEKGRSLTVGTRWTHISNGQGLGAHNPSFDGRGVFVQYERELKGPARVRS
jgi:lipid A 3-O-deacylase